MAKAGDTPLNITGFSFLISSNTAFSKASFVSNTKVLFVFSIVVGFNLFVLFLIADVKIQHICFHVNSFDIIYT